MADKTHKGNHDGFDDDGDHGFHGADHGKGVTFDQFDTTTYLHSDVAADTSFIERLILQVNGFELNGSPVALPGFGTHYGMYFVIDATGHVPASGAASFDTMHIALMVDPGNNDGAPSATAQGIGFSNGTHGDFALATGMLVSAGIQVDPDGSRHPHFVQQLSLTEAGEKVFGGSLDTGSLLEELLTTPGGPQTIPTPGGGSVQIVNGWGTGHEELVPQTPLSVRPGLLDHHPDSLFCASHS